MGGGGEAYWSEDLASDRSLDIFVSEIVTVAVKLFYSFIMHCRLTKNYADFKSSYESLSFRFDKNGVA